MTQLAPSFSNSQIRTPFLDSARLAKHLALSFTAGFALSTAQSQIFVANYYHNRVSEYTLSGAPVNLSLITGFTDVEGVALDGSGYLYTADKLAGTIGKYTTAGDTVNASFITGLSSPVGMKFDGSGHMFVANAGGTISEYSTSGTLLNPAFITGLGYLPPDCMSLNGNGHLFVLFGLGTPGYVGEWTTSGAVVNRTLISGLRYPGGIELDSQGHLFVGDYGDGIVAEYTTTGALVNSTLMSGLGGAWGLTLDGQQDLLVIDASATRIGQYNLNSGLLNNSFITGLGGAFDLAIQVPEPSSATLLVVAGALILRGTKPRRRGKLACPQNPKSAQQSV